MVVNLITTKSTNDNLLKMWPFWTCSEGKPMFSEGSVRVIDHDRSEERKRWLNFWLEVACFWKARNVNEEIAS